MPFVAKRGLPKSHRGTTYQKPIIEVRRAPAHPVGKLIPSAKLSDELGRLIADAAPNQPLTCLAISRSQPRSAPATATSRPQSGRAVAGKRAVWRREPVASKRASALSPITRPRPPGANRSCRETPRVTDGKGRCVSDKLTPHGTPIRGNIGDEQLQRFERRSGGDCRCRRNDLQAGGNFALFAIPRLEICAG